jgi:hypothetical protein
MSLPFEKDFKEGKMVEEDSAEENIMDTKYRLYLEKDLIEPTLVEIKVASDPYEEKLQYIQLHEEVQEEKQNNSNAALKDLLERIRSTKHPEIGLLLSLKVLLSNDTTTFAAYFIDLKGISVLIDLVYYRFSLKSGKVETLDAALLYEVLMCCKLVMNHSIGMKAFLDFPGCVDAIARCLFFEFKPLALLVLEILSVSCFSFASTHIVVNALKNLARTRKESQPFLSLVVALEIEDIELTAATLELVNAVLFKADDETKLLLRSLKIDKACQKKLAQVNDELSAIESTEAKDESSISRHRADIVLNVSRIASSRPQKLDHGLIALKGVREKSIRFGNQKKLFEELGKGPEKGKSEQQSEVHSKLLVVPVERTYFFQKDVLKESVLHTLTHRMIRRHGGVGDDNRDSIIFINDIESTREDTDDPMVNRLREKLRGQEKTVFILEIKSKHVLPSASQSSPPSPPSPAPAPPASSRKSLSSSPVFVNKMILIFETKNARDEWSLLIQRYRDQQLLYKGSYFVQSSYLDLTYAVQCSQRFKKSFEDFSSFFVEERKQSVEACGVDVNDLGSIYNYLVDEMAADGKEDKLLLLLQQLLLISANDDDKWTKILRKVQKIVRFSGNDDLSILSGDEEDDDTSGGKTNLLRPRNKDVLRLLRQKSSRDEEKKIEQESADEETNSNSFSQIARAVILQKQEIKELKRKLQEANSSTLASSHANGNDGIARTFSSSETALNNRSFMMLHHTNNHNENDSNFGMLVFTICFFFLLLLLLSIRRSFACCGRTRRRWPTIRRTQAGKFHSV